MSDDICIERVCNFTARCQTGPFIEYIPSYAVDRQFQDVVFLCKGGLEFVTHRNIIAAVSNFVAHLIEDFRREVVYISFPDVEASDMKTLFNLLSSGGTTVNGDQLVEIIDIITFLGIKIPNVEISSSSLKCTLDDVMKVADDQTSLQDLNNDGEDEATSSVDIQNRQPVHLPNLESYSLNKTFNDEKKKHISVHVPTEPICTIIETDIPEDDLSDGEIILPENNRRASTFTSTNHRKDSKPHSFLQRSVLRSHLLTDNIKKEPTEDLEGTLTQEEDCVLIPNNENTQSVKRNGRDQSQYSEQLSVIRSHLFKKTFDRKHLKQSVNTSNKSSFTIVETDIPDTDMRRKNIIVPGDIEEDSERGSRNESVLDNRRKTKFSPRNKLVDNTTEFSKEQEALLEEAYSINEFPSIEDQKILAGELTVSKKDVKYWFANRRAMGRADKLEKDVRATVKESLNNGMESGRTLHEIFQEIVKNAQRPEKSRRSHSLKSPVKVWVKKEVEENSMVEEDVNESHEMPDTEIEENKPKKTVLTKKEIRFLESLYKKNKYPSRELIRKYARQTNKTFRLIDMWFTRRRLKNESGTLEDSENAKSSRLGQGRDVTKFSEDQECHLEAAFRVNEFPSVEDQKILADELQVSKKDIKCWFANRRAMERADGLKKVKRKYKADSIYGAKLTDGQRKILEQAFHKKRCPSKKMLSDLADELGVRHSSVARWFRYRQWKANKNFSKKGNSTEQDRGINRSIFSDEQRAILEEEYNINKFPTKKTLEHLSEEIGFPVRVIHQWFGRTRFKEKKMCEGNPDSQKPEGVTESEEDSTYEPTKYKTVKEKPVDDNDKMDTVEQENDFESDSSNIADPDSSLNLSDLDVSEVKKMKPKTEQSCSNGLKLTEGQRKILEGAYRKKKCPSKKMLNELADELGVRVQSVMRWFRCRQRKADKASLRRKNISEQEKNVNRSIFSDEQRAILEKEYEKSKFPTRKTLERLSEKIGFSAHVISQWFGRTRFKEKKKPKAKNTRINQKPENVTDSEDGQSRDYITPEIPTEFIAIKEEPVDEYETCVQENALESDSMSNEPESSINISALDASARESVISDSEQISSHSEIIKEQRNNLKQAYMKKKSSEDSILRELANKLGLNWFGSDQKQEETVEEHKLETNKNARPYRTVFTDEHRHILSEEYKINKFPSRHTLEELSDKTGLDCHVILQWFGRTRFREKKDSDSPVCKTIRTSVADDDSVGQEDMVEIQITSETDHLGDYKLNIEPKAAMNVTQQLESEYCARTRPYQRNESLYETVVNGDSEGSDAEDPFADNGSSMDNTMKIESDIEQDTTTLKENVDELKIRNNNVLKEGLVKQKHFFSREQLIILKEEYYKNRFLSRDQLKWLSYKIGQSTNHISQWFRRTRYRERKGLLNFNFTSSSNIPGDISERKDVQVVSESDSLSNFMDVNPHPSEQERASSVSYQISESVTSVAETVVSVYPDVEENEWEDSFSYDKDTADSKNTSAIEDDSMKVHDDEKEVYILSDKVVPTRKKAIFNNSQRAILEEAFERCNYLNKRSLEDLSSKLNVQNRLIMKWFTRKRYRNNLVRKSMEFNSNIIQVNEALDRLTNEVEEVPVTDDEDTDSRPLHIVINSDEIYCEEKEADSLSPLGSGPVNVASPQNIPLDI